jgi:hypothetical protein
MSTEISHTTFSKTRFVHIGILKMEFPVILYLSQCVNSPTETQANTTTVSSWFFPALAHKTLTDLTFVLNCEWRSYRSVRLAVICISCMEDNKYAMYLRRCTED